MNSIEKKPLKCLKCGKPYRDKSFRYLDGFKIIPIPDCHCSKEKETKKAQEDKLKNTGIPKSFQSGAMRDWVDMPGSESCKKMIINYYSEIENNLVSGKGLMIIGSTGVGKTKMVSALLKRIIKNHNKTGLFVSVPTMELELSSKKEGSKEMRCYLKKMTDVDVLVLDDIVNDENSSWCNKFISMIVWSREEDKKVTFFTSTKGVAILKNVFGDQTIGRILSLTGRNIEINTSKVDMRDPINKEKYLK